MGTHVILEHFALWSSLPEFGVEDGNNITHDRAVSLLRKELPHGITRLFLLLLEECNYIYKVIHFKTTGKIISIL